MRFLWPFAFCLSLALWAQSEFSTLSRMAEISSPMERERAFHQALSRYKLSDPGLQAGIIRLLNRETKDPKWEDLEEEIWYEDYYGQLGDVCQKIATQYHNKDAWHAIVYSNYNEDSPWGLALAGEPEALPYLLELAHDRIAYYAGRGTRLLAEALARCYKPDAQNCSVVLAQRQQILALIRERVVSNVEGLDGAAILALGVCGTKDDRAFLEGRYQKVARETATDERAIQNQQAVLGLLKVSIKKIEERVSSAAIRPK